MDRARYRMWIGTEQSIRPRLIVQIPDGLVAGSSIKEPWKEEASSWPPRSYSCNFCRREFRSAQALGGHMNVHRRDRARLKQLHAGLGGEVMEEDEHHPNPSAVTSAGCHQPQVNPSSATVLPSTLSHRVSAPSTHGHWTETNFFSPSFSSSITGDNLKESLFCKTRSLLIVCDEKTNRNKRSRTDPMPAFFVRSSSCDQQQEAQPEVLNHSSHDEELDLELRLGGAPK